MFFSLASYNTHTQIREILTKVDWEKTALINKINEDLSVVLYKNLLSVKLYLMLYDEASLEIRDILDEKNVLDTLLDTKYDLIIYEKEF